jgi:hypothetical protein
MLWYYRSLVGGFAKTDRNELLEDLDRVVSEIEKLGRENGPG